MDLMEGLLTRRSIRQYDQNKKVSREQIEQIIKAAQYAPSAHNRQPWEFLILEDKAVLSELPKVQPWTTFVKNASCAILVCANTDVAFGRDDDIRGHYSFGDIDCALCSQNLMLAAHSMGLGTCFCGVAPMDDTEQKFAQMFNLPQNIRPFGLIALGYPEVLPKQPQDRFVAEKIHWGKW